MSGWLCSECDVPKSLVSCRCQREGKFNEFLYRFFEIAKIPILSHRFSLKSSKLHETNGK